MLRLEGRLVGLDVARCLALLGMVATHVLDSHTPTGELARVQWLAGGRAAALFAVLAGVSLALVTGRREPVRGSRRAAYSLGLAGRAALIAAIGLVLGSLETNIAVILTYYGVLFVLGLPFLGLRPPALVALAAVWVVAGPVLSHLVRPLLPPRGVSSPQLGHLAEPGQLLSELLLTGYYPALPWLAYLLVGIALGRCDLRSPRLGALLSLVGLALVGVATAASRLLTADPDVRARLAAELPGLDPATDVMTAISSGMFGNTPTGGSWEWLLVVAPHSTTPLDLAQTIGSSLLVIGVCLLVAAALDRWLKPGVVALAVLFGAGAMTLTLYSLHVVMKTPQVWPDEVPESFVWHVLVLLGVGAAFTAAGRRGPLERLVGMPLQAMKGGVTASASGTGRS